jgi:predicted nuclease of predicted toxin-antitoxin system
MAIGSVHLLLDQGLPRDAAERLRGEGINCTHVGEIGMAAAVDTEILERARLCNRVVVTLDADFHAIMAVRNASKPSVIRIRIEGLNGVAIADLLPRIVQQYGAELAAGCMITVKRRKTTCHQLSLPE